MHRLCPATQCGTLKHPTRVVKHLLIDENLPASLASILPVDCSHASELCEQATDRQIWDHARARDSVILTRDTDFFDRLMLDGPPPKVIWVRLGNLRRRDLEGLLLRRWSQITGLLVEADLIEVHQDSLEAFRHGAGRGGSTDF
jgi:predicted nuclease of predicted toxin-antitoxin system